MSVKLRTNGIDFEFWKSSTLTRSIDNLVGTASLTVSPLFGQPLPVKTGQLASFIVDDAVKCEGFIDRVGATGDSSSHDITVQFRDRGQDLIDSSVPDEVKEFEGPITVQELVQQVMNGLGINAKVINQAPSITPFEEGETIAAESGQAAFDFLQDYARKRNVFLTGDGLGNIIIYKPAQVSNVIGNLTHIANNNQNNVKSWSVDIGENERFGEILVRSQDSPAWDDDASSGEDGVNRNAIVIDNAIRKSRYLEIIAEQSMNDAECRARAEEEINIRRSRSLTYTATVAGFKSNKGQVWDINNLVNIQDDFAGVRGLFLIKEVSYSSDLTSGDITALTCVAPDAYKTISTPSKSEERIAVFDPDRI